MPLSAAWNLPIWLETAPVKAPLRWPKSSDSIRFSGIAPQLTVISGPPARGERLWSSWAMSSLPVPVSPVTRTLMSVPATLSTRLNTSIICGQAPMIWPNLTLSRRFCRPALSLRSSPRVCVFLIESAAWAA